MTTTSCPLCARRRTAAEARGLTWSSQHGPGGVVAWLCHDCTRDRLFEIEAQLPLDPPAAATLRPVAA